MVDAMTLNPDAQFMSASVIHDYIHGGRGQVVLVAPSGTNHTYLFSKPKEPSSFPDDVIFVYAMHEGKKFYIGMMEQGKFRSTQYSRFLPDTDIYKGAKYIVAMSTNQTLCDKTPMRAYNTGVCAFCGRKLDNTISLRRGIGKHCMKKRCGK